MIKPGIDNLIQWIRINKLQTWHIASTSQGGQDNTRIFTSDPEQSIESELERMRQVLEISSNQRVYIFGKTKADSKVGNYMESWCNAPSSDSNETMGNVHNQTAAHSIGYISREELDEKIHDAVERERFRTERAAFDKEKADFEREQREFNDVKNSAIGLAVEKIAPYAMQLFGIRGNNVAVAGTSAPVIAQPIQAAPIEVQQNNADVCDSFTIDEQERITEVLERYKNYDSEYLKVLSKFVDLAVSGNPISVMNGMVKLSYNDIKDFILNA